MERIVKKTKKKWNQTQDMEHIETETIKYCIKLKQKKEKKNM